MPDGQVLTGQVRRIVNGLVRGQLTLYLQQVRWLLLPQTLLRVTLDHIQTDDRLGVHPQLLDKFEAILDLSGCCPELEGLVLRKGNV